MSINCLHHVTRNFLYVNLSHIINKEPNTYILQYFNYMINVHNKLNPTNLIDTIDIDKEFDDNTFKTMNTIILKIENFLKKSM